MHLLQETPGKAALCVCFAINSNMCWKGSSGPSLPVIKEQYFVTALPVSSFWDQAGEEGEGYVHLSLFSGAIT